MCADHHLRQARRRQLLELGLLARRARPGQQNRRVPELLKQFLEIEVVLRRQDFRGRQHRHLVAVFDGDNRGLGRHQRLPAADVALQQPVHGMRSRHIVRDLPQHALLRAGRLERQHLFNALPHALVQLKADPRIQPCPRALQLQAAFEPEEFLEDQPVLRRRAERIQQPQVRIRRRKMQSADGAPAIRQLHLLQNVRRQRIGLRRQASPERDESTPETRAC